MAGVQLNGGAAHNGRRLGFRQMTAFYVGDDAARTGRHCAEVCDDDCAIGATGEMNAGFESTGEVVGNRGNTNT